MFAWQKKWFGGSAGHYFIRHPRLIMRSEMRTLLREQLTSGSLDMQLTVLTLLEVGGGDTFAWLGGLRRRGMVCGLVELCWLQMFLVEEEQRLESRGANADTRSEKEEAHDDFEEEAAAASAVDRDLVSFGGEESG
jgi:hypothetical protein